MAIQDRAQQRRERKLLTSCPLEWCQADLSGYVKTSVHFLNEHGPEDFGLAPLGEGRINEGHDRPLFEEISAEAATDESGFSIHTQP